MTSDVQSLSPTEKHQLTTLHELLAELARYENVVKNQKIVFFRPLPNGDQMRFFEEQTAGVRVVLGSNRSGKTTIGGNEAWAHMLGFRPWFPEDHPLRTVRMCDGRPIPVPNVGRIIAQNYEQAIRQTIMKKFDEWFPRAYIKRIEKNTRGIPVTLECTNGSVVYLMSNDQDDMAFEGPNGHWFWADEPIDYRKYTGLRRGLVDYDGHCWLTMTPLTQPWINDVVVSRANDPDSDVRLFKFSIWDNCEDFGGTLSRRAIESFLADLREDELEARLHGNFLHLAGLVYKEWEPLPPFYVDPFDIPLSWPRVCVIDPHPRKPIAVLWAACAPTNTWYAYRTLFNPGLKTVKDVADHIKELEGWGTESAEPVALRIIDWHSETMDRTSGMSVRRGFMENDLICAKAKKQDADYGYDALHEAFKIDNEWGTPGLVIFNTCPAFKQNMMNFCYDDWATNRQKDLHGDKQEYRKVNDDFIDCARYIFQHRLTFSMLRSMLHVVERKHDNRVMSIEASMFEEDGLRTGIGLGMLNRRSA